MKEVIKQAYPEFGFIIRIGRNVMTRRFKGTERRAYAKCTAWMASTHMTSVKGCTDPEIVGVVRVR